MTRTLDLNSHIQIFNEIPGKPGPAIIKIFQTFNLKNLMLLPWFRPI